MPFIVKCRVYIRTSNWSQTKRERLKKTVKAWSATCKTRPPLSKGLLLSYLYLEGQPLKGVVYAQRLIKETDPKGGSAALVSNEFQRPIFARENEYKAFLDYANTLVLSLKKSNKTIGEWKKEAGKVDKLVRSCEIQFGKVVKTVKDVLGAWDCAKGMPPYICKMPESYAEKVENALDKWEVTWEKFMVKIPNCFGGYC